MGSPATRAVAGVVLPTLVSLALGFWTALTPPEDRGPLIVALAVILALLLGVLLFLAYSVARHLLNKGFVRRSAFDALAANLRAATDQAKNAEAEMRELKTKVATLESQTSTVSDRTYYKDETVRIASLPQHSNALLGYTFEHCVILGPAVLWLESGIHIDQNNLGAGGRGADDFFTLLPDTTPPPPGAIVLTNCTFRRNCDFQRISFVGHAPVIRMLREGFNLPPDPIAPNRAERRSPKRR